MAVRRHRRRMRTGLVAVHRYIVPPAIVVFIQNRVVPNGSTGSIGSTSNSELDKIMAYFMNLIDTIIKQQTLTESISLLHNFINDDTIKTQVEYYKIMEVIEMDLVSMVANISEGTNTGIIAMRIEYIKSLIDILPFNPQSVGELSQRILQLIEEIIGGATLVKIAGNVNDIKTYINEKYGVIDELVAIQDMILSIICNIMEGVPTGIIATRIGRLRELIAGL